MKKIRKKALKDFILEIVTVLFGATGYAIGVNLFLQPLQINMGGVTGIATVINILTNAPVGIMIIIINVPLIIMAWRMLGLPFIIRSAIGMFLMSIVIDLVPVINIGGTDMLLNCVFGGAIMGFSIGLMFTKGYSMGGSDFAVWMLKKKFPHMSTGIIYFIVDALVISFAAFATKSTEQLLYSAITIFVCQKVIDLVMSMGEGAEMIYIISEKSDEICECLTVKFDRGVTLLNGKGYYTGNEKQIIMCAMPRAQLYPLLRKLKEIDPDAFIITGKANKVLGEGFMSLEG